MRENDNSKIPVETAQNKEQQTLTETLANFLSENLEEVSLLKSQREEIEEAVVNHLVSSLASSERSIDREKYSHDNEIDDFWENLKGKQKIQFFLAQAKVMFLGIKEPKDFIQRLSKSVNTSSFFKTSYTKGFQIDSFKFDRLSIGFLKTLKKIQSENTSNILDRLDMLGISLSPWFHKNEKVVEIIDQIAIIPDNLFNRRMAFLNKLSWAFDTEMFHYDESHNTIINPEFIAKLRVLTRGLTQDEEKIFAKMEACYLLSGRSIQLSLIFDTSQHQYIQDIYNVLVENATTNENVASSKDGKIITFLEKSGYLSKISELVTTAGLHFSQNKYIPNKSYQYSYGSFLSKFKMPLGDETFESLEPNQQILEAINLAYDNRLNPNYNIIRSLFRLHSIESTTDIPKIIDYLKIISEKIQGMESIRALTLLGQLESDSYISELFSEVEQLRTILDNHVDFTDSKYIKNIIAKYIRKTVKDIPRTYSEELEETDEELEETDEKLNHSEPKNLVAGSIDVAINNYEELFTQEGFYTTHSLYLDGEKIAKQKVDVIYALDNKVNLQFTLGLIGMKKLKFMLQHDKDLEKEHFFYQGSKISNSIVFRVNEGIKINVCFSYEGEKDLATHGLVNVEIDRSKIDADVSISSLIERPLNILCGVKDGETVYTKPDQKGKEAAINEALDLNNEKLNHASLDEAYIFEQQRIFLANGRSEQLRQRYGNFASYHNIYSVHHLASMLTGGLLSSHNRFRRGKAIEGMSGHQDFDSGGANYVFVRTVTENSQFRENKQGKTEVYTTDSLGNYSLVFKPELWDRTDFFIYSTDKYGSRRSLEFKQRLSPDSFLERANLGKTESNNEQMFEGGIPPEMFAGLLVPDYDRNYVIESLRSQGINEVGGIPVEEFVVSKSQEASILNIFDVAYGRTIGETLEIRTQEKTQSTEITQETTDTDDITEKQDITPYEIDFDSHTLFESGEIIGKLNAIPETNGQFDESAHVSEGFTIGEHTIMVLDQAKKYFLGKNLFQEVSAVLKINENRLMVGLALHDIGKNLSQQETGGTSAQHKYTEPLMRDILTAIGFDEQQIQFLVKIFSNDYLGKYLISPNPDNENNLASFVQETATSSGISVETVFNLLYMYYMSDASSYTKDATGEIGYLDTINLFNFGNEKLSLTEGYQQSVNNIMNNLGIL